MQRWAEGQMRVAVVDAEASTIVVRLPAHDTRIIIRQPPCIRHTVFNPTNSIQFQSISINSIRDFYQSRPIQFFRPD